MLHIVNGVVLKERFAITSHADGIVGSRSGVSSAYELSYCIQMTMSYGG